MANIEHLTTLIKSLSKSEKRYFRWSYPWQSGDKVYGDLYDMLEKGNHSSQSIKIKLKQAYPDAVLEPACKHLYKMLMRSLRNYEAEKSVENKLINLLGDVRILFNKGIFELCFSEIEKAKNMAYRHEKFGYYLLFARLELQYLTSLEFPNTDETTLLEKQEKINDLLYHELFINRHASLYELLTYRYHKQGNVRSETESALLYDLLLEESQVSSTKKYSSFESDKLHLHFQSTYFLMSGSPEHSLQIFRELNDLFLKNKSLWADSPVYYVYLLHGILTDLHLIEEHENMPFFLEELQQVQPNANSLLILKQHLVYFHQLGFLTAQGKFNDALATAREYEKQFMSKTVMVPPNTLAAMYFRLAVVYFSIKDYTKSLQLVNTILNTSGSFISSQLYVLGRLLHLLIHLELRNEDYLHYEIKSVERKLKKSKKLFTLEKITLQFLKKWLSMPDRNKALQYYAGALAELEENNYENQLLRQFPFRRWVQGHLQKTPFLEVGLKQNTSTKKMSVPQV
ncbi:hypothetical protein [Pontibacter beigongshangensis]|uniref:hypothetical protein n=1 Tax=Pontibacter beigongshangensis TaxID=2574733 RepID=UPI001650A058|nr:hypothetical protein [Pontibacter beigongshangensis]